MTAIIEAKSLTRKFGQRTAVDNLSMEVSAGEVIGFLGPNGAGKTTTIRMLAGIIAPSSGEAIVAGMRPAQSPEALHEHIGLLTESPGFYNRMSAKRNLEFFGGFYPIEINRQVEKYLKLMGLWERREDQVGGFSKGMKQRLALARALLHEPKIIFLDEPTSGLDPEAAKEVRGIIKSLGTEGRTVFLSTHNLAEAEELCPRIAIFRTKLLALDTTDNLRKLLFPRQVVVRLETTKEGLVPDGVKQAVKELSYVTAILTEGNQLIVTVDQTEFHMPQLVRVVVDGGGRILEIAERQHSLEEIYLTMVGEKQNGK